MKLCLKIPILRTFYRQYAFAKFQKAWRKRNAHNRTVAMNVFPMECVEVGNGTYGELHVLSFLPEEEKLSIGNYVSMASNIHFILNGNHQTRTLFTYPLRSVLQGTQCPEDNLGKGPIIVEDEAWIGYGAIILSGVNDSVRQTLVKSGFAQTIGEENICPHIHAALARAREVLEKVNKQE